MPSAAARLGRALDPRHWQLALRVVVVTTLLSILAMLAVGAYLSSVIADGLYEQRRDRVLEETLEVRTDLTDTLTGLAGATSTQQQDASNAFVQSAGGPGGGDRREVALVPVETSGVVFPVASSDSSLFQEVDDEFAAAVAQQPDEVLWRSIGREDEQGRTVPALLVGTRVVVPGVGSYDLYLVFSMQEEQETLAFVQSVILGGGGVLLTLVVGIAIVVARLVTIPLRRAAVAAERIAGGDLRSRVEVSGGDELARVGVSFNGMAATLEQKVEDLTELSRVQHRFVADVSHELRTPLTTIRMATSVLHADREHLPEDLRRPVELLSAQVERFEVLLADLLEISRFDAGAAQLEASREDLDDLVLRAVEDVRHLAGARGCLLDVRLAGHGMHAVVEARRIDRILRNLLTNAIEHGAGSPVLVQTAGSEDAVAVVVQDYGHGISPEAARRVFDRFWRADPSRARTLGGTGLGLSISVEDARLHSGWLQAWGQEGAGAVFRLTLPRRPGITLARSPLPLQRSFDRADAGTYSITPTGEIRIDPAQLPALGELSPTEEGGPR
ncbi:MtrAB system histidine kinase MtrB [Brachybacterium sp. J153]|uniref:MtrAB system histidine kinase MtrB n=1 Tax=Brachybacterium sp. J153 TaxID=3116488 RepID=UPI002E772791|nr:MtrAB system histidine kinase MtrB [Brachybacterium sp. J153]MEE1616910.1 MtrAB system histidine kinase MtrB [Brachybacterium sp. J153]